MNVLKLNIDEFEDSDFHLLAIHSQLDDYRLVYFINKVLDIHLIKSKKEIAIKLNKQETFFSRFIFEDESNDFFWDLFENKSFFLNLNNEGLFGNTNSNIETIVHLIPEYKKVDYFLKIYIDQNLISISNIINQINSIKGVSMIYEVEFENLKSKYNLIF